MQSTARSTAPAAAVADVARFLDNQLRTITNHTRSVDPDHGIVTVQLHWRDALVLGSVLENYLQSGRTR